MNSLSSLQIRTYHRLGQRGAIFGMSILDEVQNNPKIIVLTADLASLSGLDRFINKYPDNFFNIGIAEQNMVGIAAGLSSEGYIPIATTYATFISLRSCEQIRHYLGYMDLKVIIIGSGAGLIQSYSGNTHYAIEDIAIMRSIPNMTVFSPSDAGQAAKLLETAISINGPVYIRLTGGLNCPIVYKEDYTLEIGKSITVKEGKDITIFATGIMVYNSLQAADLLQAKGISACVVDVHTIKPIDIQTIKDCADSRLFVSVEEHNIIGGLGGAISEVLSEAGNQSPLLRLGIKDTFSKAGDYQYLLGQNRLLPEQITEDIVDKYVVI
jgi:transketolase